MEGENGGREGKGLVKELVPCMSDAWTWTMERQLTVGRRGGLGGEDKRQKKSGTTVIE